MNNKWKITLLWSICCSLMAPVDVVASCNFQQSDSIPQIERKIYRGFRVHLTEIEVQQRKSNQIKIKYTAINTGREPVSLGAPTSIPEHLIILFDGSLAEQNLTDYADQIRQELTQTSLRLEPGFIRSNLDLSFSTKGTIKSGDSDLATKGGTTTETTQIKEKASTDNTDPNTTEMDLNACADLSIQDVKIKSKGRKNITLEITLINLGAGPAKIYRDKERKTPQVALRGNFSSTENLSRGDVVIGGDYIETKNDNPHGWLKPMESFTTTVKFDMRKKSKFTPFLILELDAYNGLAECDETNNLGVVKVEE